MSDPVPVVFILDADVSARESIADVAAMSGMRSEAFSSALHFLERPRSPTPCCLVLDQELLDWSGFELQAFLAAQGAATPLIFTTSCNDVATAVRAMKAGAFEFLRKPVDADAMRRALMGAVERSRLELTSQAKVQLLRSRLGTLTAREREVMNLVVTGHLNKQVGGVLGISEVTVKSHRGRVMAKMCATSLPHLVTMAAALSIGLGDRVDGTSSRGPRYPFTGASSGTFV